MSARSTCNTRQRLKNCGSLTHSEKTGILPTINNNEKHPARSRLPTASPRARRVRVRSTERDRAENLEGIVPRVESIPNEFDMLDPRSLPRLRFNTACISAWKVMRRQPVIFDASQETKPVRKLLDLNQFRFQEKIPHRQEIRTRNLFSPGCQR